MRNNTAV